VLGQSALVVVAVAVEEAVVLLMMENTSHNFLLLNRPISLYPNL
jgi:hypothetical protein